LFEKYRTFIDKAQSYSSRFNPAVVEKVIADNTEKINAVAGVLDPLVPSAREMVLGLQGDREGVLAGVEASRLELEELELRQMIGEMEDEAFESATGELKSAIDSADEKVSAIDDELSELTAVLDEWLEHRPGEALADDAGDQRDDGDELLGDVEEDDGVELESDQEDDVLGFEDGFDDDEDPGDSGVHAERVSVSDDVSAVFEGDEEPIEAGDAGGIDFSASEINELGEDLFAEPKDEGEAEEDGEGSGVLILGEGTDEEALYPVTDGVLSLGRGRDNSVQVKNDSKVSRYHCKLFQRDGHYFIADNKSANGTLVDGELVTEKRLVGGEEVIIGETFFRFRIQH
jgi:hypothetical protein